MIHFALQIPEKIKYLPDFGYSTLVMLLDDSLQEAAMSFLWFEDAMEESDIIHEAQYEAHIEEQQRAIEKYRNVINKSDNRAPLNTREFTIESFEQRLREQERENWLRDRQREIDIVLDWLPHRASFIHARNFLYSLDRIGRLLKVLGSEGEYKEQFSSASDQFSDLFPTLREHRNSSAHIEERLLNPKFSNEPGQALHTFISESLAGRAYQNTLANGAIGSVEVSIETLHIVHSIIHAAFVEIASITPSMTRNFSRF
jgi:hypothetical protein